LTEGFHYAWWACCLIAVLSLPVALLVPRSAVTADDSAAGVSQAQPTGSVA
jgi:hypothetical protein